MSSPVSIRRRLDPSILARYNRVTHIKNQQDYEVVII